MIRVKDVELEEISVSAIGMRQYKGANRRAIIIKFDSRVVPLLDLYQLFEDDTTFTIVNTVTDPKTGEEKTVVNEVKDYQLAGELIWNRDRTVSVYMYAYTKEEIIERENAALLMELLIKSGGDKR